MCEDLRFFQDIHQLLSNPVVISKCNNINSSIHVKVKKMWMKSVLFLLLGLCISGGDDVVDVGAYKGLDLFILLLLQYLADHVKVTVHRILHQYQVGSQALLHSTFGVLAHPLEVVASLHMKSQSKGLTLFSTTVKLHLKGCCLPHPSQTCV